MAAEADPQAAAPARRPQFWVAPLLAGCCFSLGYGITHRLMAMQSSVRPVRPESFSSVAFPGSSLDNLRSRSGDRVPLQVDLAAIDARKPPETTAKPTAPAPAQVNVTPPLAMQTPPAAPWSAPELVQPAVAPEPDVSVPFVDPLVDTPLLEVPLLEAAASFEPEPSDEFFLPVVPQAPPPPTP